MIQGSSVLIQSLLAAGLIDEFWLFVFPVLLGGGKRLFGDGARSGTLELVEVKTLPTGIVVCRYRPAGPLSTGSFALEEPTQAELSRREKIEQES